MNQSHNPTTGTKCWAGNFSLTELLLPLMLRHGGLWTAKTLSIITTSGTLSALKRSQQCCRWPCLPCERSFAHTEPDLSDYELISFNYKRSLSARANICSDSVFLLERSYESTTRGSTTGPDLPACLELRRWHRYRSRSFGPHILLERPLLRLRQSFIRLRLILWLVKAQRNTAHLSILLC